VLWVGVGILGGWFVLALLVELGAWHALRLGHRRAPPAFRAAPAVGPDADTVALAFLGDVQRGIADVARPLAAALDDHPAALLVSSGDLVAHGEAPYYGVLLDAFEAAGIETPTRVVPGNHDLQPRGVRDTTRGYALFETHFGPPYWAVDAGPLRVVGVDDVLGVDDVQVAWIREARDGRPGAPWIAVCHRPPREVDEEEAPVGWGLEELVRVLEERPPLLVVCGHKHAYTDRVVNGVRYVVNAHGGDVHGLALDRDPSELLRVEVRADGTSSHEVVRLARRPWLRVYANQLAVRCWWSRRRRGGALLSLPAALPLSALGLRAPLR
jgi:hypothetical protein